MNRTEMAGALAKQTGLTKADASKVLKVLFDGNTGLIAQELSGGGDVRLTGFGTLSTKHRAAREARNPHTGEPIQVPAKRAVYFKAGSQLVQRLNS